MRPSAAAEDTKTQPSNHNLRAESGPKPSLLRRAMDFRVRVGSVMRHKSIVERGINQIDFEPFIGDKRMTIRPDKEQDGAVKLVFPGEEKFESLRKLPVVGRYLPKYERVHAVVPESGPVTLGNNGAEMTAKKQVLLAAQVVLSTVVIHVRH